MTVLVVEDDEIILDGLKYSLMQEGYEVFAAVSAADARKLVQSGRSFDFCLLDVMLPDGNGFEICEEVRKVSNVPILFLTACDDEVSTVRALELGADDYIAKPFRIRELLARMRAVLRRSGMDHSSVNSIVNVGENQVNMQTGKVYRNNEEVILTAMEYKLLLVFIHYRGQVLTRSQILDRIWDEAGDFVNDNTLSVYIKRLRKKLGDTGENQLIKTIRGTGYRMEK
ncbi:MAG: response regulator transcription factor [Clostridium sp.]|nr:response regulator transcription factor [Clostridium sp.]